MKFRLPVQSTDEKFKSEYRKLDGAERKRPTPLVRQTVSLARDSQGVVAKKDDCYGCAADAGLL